MGADKIGLQFLRCLCLGACPAADFQGSIGEPLQIHQCPQQPMFYADEIQEVFRLLDDNDMPALLPRLNLHIQRFQPVVIRRHQLGNLDAVFREPEILESASIEKAVVAIEPFPALGNGQSQQVLDTNHTPERSGAGLEDRGRRIGKDPTVTALREGLQPPPGLALTALRIACEQTVRPC